jgi:hypothetical protein
LKKRIIHPHPVWRLIRLVSGILLLLLAIVGGMLPVLQGWIFLIPALLLLAPESRLIRKIVVRIRTRFKLRRRRRRRARAGQAGRSDPAQRSTRSLPRGVGSSGREKAH